MAKIFEVYDTPNSTVEEAYRTLRTNMRFSGMNTRHKTLAVVSFNPKEGKTTVSINLSISVARAGIKVLLVDADMRKPEFVKRLGGKDKKGLSSYITENLPLRDVISNTNIPKLYYLSCGPKPDNPLELISSQGFTRFLHEAAKEFGMVIIDTSALGVVIDGAVIASQTDATAIVLEAKKIPIEKAKKLKEQLEKANANIIGVILNKISKCDYNSYHCLLQNNIYNNDLNNYKKKFT